MTADRALAAAEQRLAAIKSRPRTESVEQEIARLEDLIDETAPDSLAGAVVKLRRLADPEQLLINTEYERGLAELSARQILAAVEQILAARLQPDPFLAALPEYHRVHGLAMAALKRAEQPVFAMPKEKRRALKERHGDSENFPEPHGSRFREAARLQAQAGELFDRLDAIGPTTIAGAIAKLELHDLGEETALACLRALAQSQARGIGADTEIVDLRMACRVAQNRDRRTRR